MIHFLRPEWLLALIPLALLLWLRKRQRHQASSWNRYIAPHLAKVLVSGQASNKKQHLGLIAFIWLVSVLALSGPALTKQQLPVFEANLGRVIVVDMSLSMYATDLAPNRLTQAKFKATDLIKSLKEGETGLVAYAGDAFTISPLTRDKSTLLNLLPTLSPEIMPVLGSNLPAALEQAKQLLVQGGHLKGEIILLADGVNPDQISEAKSILEDTQYRLSIIAMGTKQGAAIRLPDGQLMRDQSDQVVVSQTDLAQLNSVIGNSGGKLFAYRADGKDLEALTQSLSQESDAKTSDLQGEAWQDLGPYLALFLLLPALLSFRHAFAALACLAILAPSPEAQAASWQHPFSTDDQRAMQAYQAQDYQGAAEQFTSPQWKAASLYKNGDYQEALELFEQDDSASGLFNQGNSLMQLNDLDKAIERYQQALKKDPQLTQAEQNLELAEQLKQQQQTSQDQGQSDKDQSNQDSNKQEQSQQEGTGQNQGQQQGQGDQQSGQGSRGQQSQGQNDQGQNAQGENAQGENGQDSNQQGASQESPEQETPEQQASGEQDASQDGQSQDQQAGAANDAQMSADPAKDAKKQMDANASQSDASQQMGQGQQPQADQESTQAQAASMTQGKPGEGDEQGEPVAAATNAIAPEDLPPEMQRALTGVIDDPQVLLRNKMQLEYQKRRRQGATIKDNQQW
ncbi:VWA domain-containing protein [Shewanella halotolerans]|uniref:VWA domain-containing protein n=1 Tax=Shewanella halotolerans TaxID=2864204 RepID=UPI001C65B2DD|nr:VWA domain-containing protein [Shewanella halotolerans]QYJ91409.1 VWA domain-containing protein [Shewanella halotolerans]